MVILHLAAVAARFHWDPQCRLQTPAVCGQCAIVWHNKQASEHQQLLFSLGPHSSLQLGVADQPLDVVHSVVDTDIQPELPVLRGDYVGITKNENGRCITLIHVHSVWDIFKSFRSNMYMHIKYGKHVINEYRLVYHGQHVTLPYHRVRDALNRV